MGRLHGVQYWTTTGTLKPGGSFVVFVSLIWGIGYHSTRSHLLGPGLLKNLKRALSWSKTHRAIADNVSKSLPEDTLAAWIKVRQEFDQDPSRPNPYEEPETCMYLGLRLPGSYAYHFTVVTVETLRCQLDEDNESDTCQGHAPLHTMTPSTFIWTAIKIEEQQYVFIYLPFPEIYNYVGETYVPRKRKRSRPIPLGRD